MKTAPLKRLAKIRTSNVDKKSADGQIPVRLCNYTDVYYRDEISPEQSFMSATASADQVKAFALRPGDVIITKDSETAEDIGVPTFVRASAPDLVCGYHLAIIRPDPCLLDGRYLYWFMSSASAREQLSVAATGVTRFGLRSESAGAVAAPVWDMDRQRVIAGYLDTETAHIDALIAKKQVLHSLLAERMRGAVDAAVAEGPEVPLRRVISRLTSGPRGWAEYVSDGGETPFIRITNIRRGNIELDRGNLLKVAAPRNAEAIRTAVLRNDVMVSITADIGSVAIAREQDVGSVVSQHVALLTSSGCEPEWLAYSILSTFARNQLEAGQYGGTKTQLSLGDVASLKIRIPSGSEQRRCLAGLNAQLARLRIAHEKLETQLALLRERRQALINAAVAGEVGIPGVAS